MVPELSEAIWAAVIIAGAYTVRGIAGFGSGLIAIPLLTLSYPLTVVVPVVVALDYFGSLGQGIKNRRAVSWRDLAPLLPFTAIGVLVALFLYDTLDANVLRLALGTFVLVMGTYQLLGLPAIKATRFSALPYGFLGGLVGTLFGTGGPFYVLYLGMRALDKDAIRASFAMWFVIDGTIRLGGYAAAGIIGTDSLKLLALALPFAVAGLFVGGRIHLRLPQDQFKRFISVLLVASGIALITK